MQNNNKIILIYNALHYYAGDISSLHNRFATINALCDILT